MDYVLGKLTLVPGFQEILNWMAIGVSTVRGGKWDDKGKFKAFVMLLATNKGGPWKIGTPLALKTSNAVPNTRMTELGHLAN